MTTRIMIDGKWVKFSSAYVCFREKNEEVQIVLSHNTTPRVRLVDDVDIETECPITFDRWIAIAHNG